MEHPLRELRKTVGMNQGAFAEALSTHPTYISQIETGIQPMGSTVALRVAEVFRTEMNRLGITVEDLLRGSRERGIPEADRAAG